MPCTAFNHLDYFGINTAVFQVLKAVKFKTLGQSFLMGNAFDFIFKRYPIRIMIQNPNILTRNECRFL